jgi:GTP-binding protein HflX
MTKENVSLEELKRTWMGKMKDNCIFISAQNKENIEEFKQLLYDRVKEMHIKRYPYNNLFY